MRVDIRAHHKTECKKLARKNIQPTNQILKESLGRSPILMHLLEYIAASALDIPGNRDLVMSRYVELETRTVVVNVEDDTVPNIEPSPSNQSSMRKVLQLGAASVKTIENADYSVEIFKTLFAEHMSCDDQPLAIVGFPYRIVFCTVDDGHPFTLQISQVMDVSSASVSLFFHFPIKYLGSCSMLQLGQAHKNRPLALRRSLREEQGSSFYFVLLNLHFRMFNSLILHDKSLRTLMSVEWNENSQY